MWEATAGTSGCRQHAGLESGSRVTQIKVRWENTSGRDAGFVVHLYSASTGIHASVETFAPVGQIVGDNTATLVLATPITLGEGEDVSIVCNTAATGDRLRMVQVFWSRP